MYRVLVAEDECVIRKGIVFSVPWSELDCTVVAEAGNGQEGIEMIEKHRPDIVIVDINMPVVDGLEMIEKTYSRYCYSAIILSGYSDFEYAKEAISYGVTGYLLKPLQIEEMTEALHRAKQECEVRKAYKMKLLSKEDLKNVSLLKEYCVSQNKDTVVMDMLRFIYNNYQKKLTMHDLVNHLNYSETFLNTKFREVIGTTFNEYLNRYRIQKALEMINNGNDLIQDIAWKCGIGDYKYFGLVFRKYMGCTPKEYIHEIKD